MMAKSTKAAKIGDADAGAISLSLLLDAIHGANRKTVGNGGK